MTAPSAPSEDVASRKAALRKSALAARAALTDDVRASASLAVAAGGGEIVAREKPACVSLFMPVKGEIDTFALAEKLSAAGVKLCLPVIVARNAPLVFRAWAPGDPLDDRPFGLREPPESAEQATPDLLFVPLAAFDREGRRIGYGGGFYDRTLEQLRARGAALAVGLGFAVQEVDEVPALDHDLPLDGVLTEAGYRPVGGDPS